MKKLTFFLPLFFFSFCLSAQNSLVGDGFGGRLWYKPYNYSVGSYSGYSVCGSEGQLYGWGSNNYGQLGNTSVQTTTSTPVKVKDMDSVIYYSSGYIMGAIKAGNSGWIWGTNNPTAIKVIDDVFFVDAGANSCAFVKNDGSVWSVGANTVGEFGNGTAGGSLTPSNVPQQMSGITNAVRTAQGVNTTCVLLGDGTVFAAGVGPGLGDGAGGIALTPTRVLGLKDIVDIKATTYCNFALDKNGHVWSWGAFDLGQGTINSLSTATKIDALNDIVAISACNDGFHCLALDENNVCYGWGNFPGYGLGNNSFNPVQSPIVVAENVVDIMAGEFFSYLIKSDGSLWASGSGDIFFDKNISDTYSFQELDLVTLGIDLCLPAEQGELSNNNNPDSTDIPSEVVVIFPNAFSPNGDDLNDYFRAILKNGAILEKYKLEIYNRWGMRVFYTEDVSKGWDGLIGGEEQQTASYYYQVTFATPNRKPVYIKGDLTLVR